MKTFTAKPNEVERKWFVVDAEGEILGRLASEIATLLRGKHKPIYTPHIDTGDYVIVINAEKVQVTGTKAEKKAYHRHSGYPGGLKTTPYRQMLEKQPRRLLEKAVKGMLPKGSLGRQQLKKLKVVVDPNHPHLAQNPELYTLRNQEKTQ